MYTVGPPSTTDIHTPTPPETCRGSVGGRDVEVKTESNTISSIAGESWLITLWQLTVQCWEPAHRNQNPFRGDDVI